MLRILAFILGLFLLSALPGSAKAMETGVDCHGIVVTRHYGTAVNRHARLPAETGKSAMDCCMGASLCRLACTPVDPAPLKAAAPSMMDSGHVMPADSHPLKGQALPPPLGPPRAFPI